MNEYRKFGDCVVQKCCKLLCQEVTPDNMAKIKKRGVINASFSL